MNYNIGQKLIVRDVDSKTCKCCYFLPGHRTAPIEIIVKNQTKNSYDQDVVEYEFDGTEHMACLHQLSLK